MFVQEIGFLRDVKKATGGARPHSRATGLPKRRKEIFPSARAIAQ